MKRTDKIKNIGLKKKYIVYFNKFFKHIKGEIGKSIKLNELSSDIILAGTLKDCFR